MAVNPFTSRGPHVSLRHTDSSAPSASGFGFTLTYDVASLRFLDAATTGAFGVDTLRIIRHAAESAEVSVAVAQKHGEGIHGSNTVARLRWVVGERAAIGHASFSLASVQILLTDGTWPVPDAAHADVNGDGMVDAADLAGIQQLHQPPDIGTPLAFVQIPALDAGEAFRLTVLVDGDMPAGTHSATFDATGLSSGLYLYRLETGTQTLTRTMTLVK